MIVLFALLALRVVALSNACADPAIVSAGLQSTHLAGALRHYDVRIVVANLGSGHEASSLLTSVEIFQDQTKVGEQGVPPLQPGARATVTYAFVRSADARNDTTHLRFQLVQRDPHGHPVSDCKPANDVARIAI